jgi:hypothetical protein
LEHNVTLQLLTSSLLAVAGTILAGFAVWNERRMQRHRQPGVTYGAVTLRRDGGWRRRDLFTAQGLEYQAAASRFGLGALVFWVFALLAWVLLAT